MSSPSSSSHSAYLQQQKLPTKPGVYIFKNASGKVIYIGKAKNLKSRVSSYFQSPIQLGPKTRLLVENIASLEHIPVTSEMEALLLESKLIKKFKPHFNLISKDDKSPYYIRITKEEFPHPVITHDSTRSTAGPFLNSLIPRRILYHFRHIIPFCTASRPVKKPCFYSHINLCSPCPGNSLSEIDAIKYRSNISRLKRLLDGQFEIVSRQLKNDMITASKNQDFESAAKIRDQILALNHLKYHPISPDKYLENPNLESDIIKESVEALKSLLSSAGIFVPELNRIEMYDNSHLSGTAATSGMVVAINGELKHNEYRHFKIKSDKKNSDTDMMLEVLSRRIKNSDWPAPDLIVLDGGIPQLTSVSLLNLPCPVIALAKRQETIIIKNDLGEFKSRNLPVGHPALKLLQSLRDEAHRFSRRLHHKLISNTLTSS